MLVLIPACRGHTAWYDFDVYRFTVPTGGQSVYLDMGTCAHFGMSWRLIDPTTGATIYTGTCNTDKQFTNLSAGGHRLELYSQFDAQGRRRDALARRRLDSRSQRQGLLPPGRRARRRQDVAAFVTACPLDDALVGVNPQKSWNP